MIRLTFYINKSENTPQGHHIDPNSLCKLHFCLCAVQLVKLSISVMLCCLYEPTDKDF